MKKKIDFLEWHLLKSKLHVNKRNDLFFKERQVWFISCGLNIGYEQDGKGKMFDRPVLILRKFNRYLFWAIPLSSKLKRGKYYYVFTFKGRKSCAILSQLRLFDVRRLMENKGLINFDDFFQIKNKVRKLI